MRVDDEQVGIFGCVQRDVEGDHGKDARGGEHAALTRLHVEKRDLATLIGKHERAQAAAADEDHAGTSRSRPLDVGARVEPHATAALGEEGPLVRFERRPKWNELP